MRWRMVDKVEALVPWRSARGRKSVSLEEYDLMLPLGREGEMPESLVLESAVALLRWLAIVGSDFRSGAILDEIGEFSFVRKVGIGEVLEIVVTVSPEAVRDSLRADCEIRSAGGVVARGTISVNLIPLASVADAEWLRGTWTEIYASA
jgi:hypothetical protein